MFRSPIVRQPAAWLGIAMLLQISILAQSGGLTINILEGDDTIVNVRQRVSREAIIQVEDENHKPVAGAFVTFSAPGRGPSVSFVNGSNTITATTDAQGRVAMQGITPNKAAGKFEIRISASKDGKTGSRVLTQTNVAAAAGAISAKTLLILLAVGGAAGGIAAGLSGRGNGTPAPVNTGVVLVPGNPTVGPPR